jgi:type II secretory pathway pseudopilin PulG
VNREANQIRSQRPQNIRMRRRCRAFTVVEYLIVVLALGILAIFVIPQFSRASQQSRQNNLKDVMQYLRTQVMVFKAQHQDIPPGYPYGNPTVMPDAGAFVAQMTQHTDINGIVGDGGPCQYGPYLTHVYKPQTQEVFANVKGQDESGTPYSFY